MTDTISEAEFFRAMKGAFKYPSLVEPVDVEQDFTKAFSLHGKTIQGTLLMGRKVGLDFTDVTAMYVVIEDGPQGPALTVRLEDRPL